jgi:lipoprotein-anchoring transpeptidase ErfK/SrfK
VVVDLAWQRLYAYRGGVEIGRAAILYGADDKPTPTGSFKILQKKKDHISNLYGAPMPFMLRLTNDGIAIHGSEVETAMPPMAASAFPTNSRPCCSRKRSWAARC